MFFHVPPNLPQDYDDALEALGERCVLNYNSATPVIFNSIISNIDFKSNMRGLSDNTRLLTCSKSLPIKKGDHVTDSKQNTYIIHWTPFEDINSRKSQIQLCTNHFNFDRWQEASFDMYGNTSTPALFVSVAKNIKGFFARAGMSAWNASDGGIGIEPSQKVFIGVQYNDLTRFIKITDRFKIKNINYMIVDIDYTQLNVGGTDGVLMLHAVVMESDEVDST